MNLYIVPLLTVVNLVAAQSDQMSKNGFLPDLFSDIDERNSDDDISDNFNCDHLTNPTVTLDCEEGEAEYHNASHQRFMERFVLSKRRYFQPLPEEYGTFWSRIMDDRFPATSCGRSFERWLFIIADENEGWQYEGYPKDGMKCPPKGCCCKEEHQAWLINKPIMAIYYQLYAGRDGQWRRLKRYRKALVSTDGPPSCRPTKIAAVE